MLAMQAIHSWPSSASRSGEHEPLVVLTGEAGGQQSQATATLLRNTSLLRTAQQLLI
jgi:hypothetical protein